MKATSTHVQQAIRCVILKRSTGISVFLLICLVSLFTACKKDKDQPGTPEDIILQVKFATGSVSYNLVDSAFVVLKKEGSGNQVFKRFVKGSDVLSFTIDDLSAGNWTAEMYIFARFNESGGRRYRQDKAFIVPAGGAKQGITLAAPTGSIADSWKPYAFFRHEELGVSIAVPLDNTNPHFDVQVRDTRWDLYYIERYASKKLGGGANAKVAEYIWMCEDNCFTSDRFINNSTGFLPFVQEVGNKEWDNGLIIVVVADHEGADVQFTHRYDK